MVRAGISGRDARPARTHEHQFGLATAANASMPNVLVRGIPEGVHAALERRAAERGQSLQQYLASELKRLAEKPSLQEVLERIDRRRGGGHVGFGQAVADLMDERHRR